MALARNFSDVLSAPETLYRADDREKARYPDPYRKDG
jgi:hypothetical protein